MSSDKVKIAYLTSHLPKEGPVQVIYDIIANIDFSKFEITIITLKEENNNTLINKFKNLPIKIIQLESTRRFNIFELSNKLKTYLKSNNIEILHSHCFRSLLLNSFTKHSIIKIHTIHIYPGFQYIAMKGVFVGKIMNFITKYSINKIDYPIACSESVKLSFLKNDNINVGCIQNGVSTLVRPLISKVELKKALNLDPNFKYFISTGRFSKEKNFLFLIEQFMRLNLKSYKLIILGNGTLFGKISSIIDNSIILTGFKQNVSDYLFASDYYISSSLTEGMPISVLEAMSAGLPVILSDIEPHKEILQKARNKEIGFVYKSNDKIDFKLKIESILKLNYINIQECVIEIYNGNFTAREMSNKYQELYIDAIN